MTESARVVEVLDRTGHIFATRSPVRTARTPGIAAAVSVRILMIRAWACGKLRNTAAWSSPGGTTSSRYSARPVRIEIAV